MDNKTLRRIFGLLAFLTALITYTLTVQDSVPFWDCSEFSSAAIWQQVPHPPGAPLFLMIGKVFDVIIPFGDPGWKINMVSAISSAFVVLLLYLITVMVIQNLRNKGISSMGDALAVYGSAFVGAAAFTFSDTFWFNAVESEVYALSALFVAVIIYLMMLWNEKADEPGHERYLLLIAYVMGLSIGVHLLALLAIFSIVLLIYFRKYEVTTKRTVVAVILSLITFWFVYTVLVSYLPAFLAGHSPGRNEANVYDVVDSTFLRVVGWGIILGIIGLFVWANQNKKPVLRLVSGAAVLVFLGYTSYTQILIRANANPPMNENAPTDFQELSSYLGREQYGNDPHWPRRVKTDEYYTRNYVKRDAEGDYVYGKWNPPSRKRVETDDGAVSVPVFENVNVAGELAYLWKYQIDHMYLRYFGWNFVGRTSDVQDAGVAFTSGNDELNDLSGYASEFPIRFFALPLIFGFIGFFFHFKEDKKMAIVYLLIFLFMGVLAAIAQRQQEPQPRERDYFYTGSFMIFAMWIGMGVYSLIDSLSKKEFKAGIAAGIVALSTLLVPFNMAYGGWDIHDRTGNYLPFDYSYNLLQSAEKDAIIFTNGDNDTFPVWYIQDVMGVRRDVRIVNLSLGNTLWYVYQLKNTQPWGAKSIPLTFSDESLLADEMASNALSYDFGEAQKLQIPVRREILAQYTDDEMTLERGTFEAQFTGKPYQESQGRQIYLYRVQDKLIKDILEVIRFERPIYFSTTVGPDAFSGLDDFFRYEGMLMRVCPVRQRSSVGQSIEMDIMKESLLNVDNSDDYSKTPQYGFKLRNLNDRSVYYDPVHRRLMRSYRQLYTNMARNYLIKENNKEMAAATLDTLNKYISLEQFPVDYDIYYSMAETYSQAGNMEKAKKYARMGIERANKVINNDGLRPRVTNYEIQNRYLGPHRYSARLHELVEDYQGAIDVMIKLKEKVEVLESQFAGSGGYEAELNRVRQNLTDVMSTIDDLEVKMLENKGDYQAAIELIEKKLEEYQNNPSQMNNTLGRMLYRKYNELKAKVERDLPETEVDNTETEKELN